MLDFLMGDILYVQKNINGAKEVKIYGVCSIDWTKTELPFISNFNCLRLWGNKERSVWQYVILSYMKMFEDVPDKLLELDIKSRKTDDCQVFTEVGYCDQVDG